MITGRTLLKSKLGNLTFMIMIARPFYFTVSLETKGIQELAKFTG